MLIFHQKPHLSTFTMICFHVFQAQPKESLLDISNTSMNSSAGTTDPWGMPLGAQQAPPTDPWGAPLPAPQQVSDAWGSQASAPATRTTPTLAAAPPPYPPAVSTDAWGMAVSSPTQVATSASTPGQWPLYLPPLLLAAAWE